MAQAATKEVKEFVFLLIDKFSMIAFASAIEPLRVANRMADNTLYDWSLASENGEAVRCSNGTRLLPDAPLADVDRDALMMQ